MAKLRRASKVFSPSTLGKFEDAAASIPIRPLDRAFERAGLRPGIDPGGAVGARKARFRRYVASVDQDDPRQVEQLGDALGALVAEAATSKHEFLIKAAELDGFAFLDGTFRPASTGSTSFAIERLDVASVEERIRRLLILTNESPRDAAAGASEFVESVCRTILRLSEKAPPRKAADLEALVESSLDLVSRNGGGSKAGAARIRESLRQLAAVVAAVREVKDITPRYARLAVGAASTFANFIAETYVERDPRPMDTG